MGVFRMPSLGADMEAGTLVEWMIAPGDAVTRGDVVAVVETQKGAIEIEIFQDGEVARLVAAGGETLPVGAPMAEISGVGEEPAAPTAPTPAVAEAPADAPPPLAPPAFRAVEGEPPPASPAARVRARELGFDLAAVKGSGPGGAIVLADVERAVEAAPTAKPAATGFDPDAMRAAIAAAMARSKREIPHYYLFHQIDLQAATDWLAEINAARPPDRRLVMGLLFVRATALALKAAPELNGVWRRGGFEPSGPVHAGVAVSLRGGGLVAPALHDADTLELDALMDKMRDLVTRARAGRLKSSEISDPTITVSSLGERGVDALQGVIFPPQAALVGFGTPARRPVVVGDAVLPREVAIASLSADHRVSDGRRGARFLAKIDDLLQKPEAL